MTNGGRTQMCGKRVPDDWICSVEASPAELSPGTRNKHAATFSRKEMCSTGDVGDQHADVFEI